MKKVIILAAVASLVVLASCKKKGVCSCTDKDGNKTVVSYEDMTSYEKKGYKSDCTSDAKATITYNGTNIPQEASTTTCDWSKK